MKFLGKWMELECTILISLQNLSSQKNTHCMHSLISGYYLRNSEYTRQQFTDNRKLKKKKDQSVDASVLLRRDNKILMGGNMETKCGAKTEGKAIQRLPHLRILPIYSHQIQKQLWLLRSACWQELDITVSWEALPEPDKYRGKCLQPTIGLSMGSPNGGVRERTGRDEGVSLTFDGKK